MLAVALAGSPRSSPAGWGSRGSCLTPLPRDTLLDSTLSSLRMEASGGCRASHGGAGGLEAASRWSAGEERGTPVSVACCPSTSRPGVQSGPHRPPLQPHCAPCSPTVWSSPGRSLCWVSQAGPQKPATDTREMMRGARLHTGPDGTPGSARGWNLGAPSQVLGKGTVGVGGGKRNPGSSQARTPSCPKALVWPSLGDPYSQGV